MGSLVGEDGAEKLLWDIYIPKSGGLKVRVLELGKGCLVESRLEFLKDTSEFCFRRSASRIDRQVTKRLTEDQNIRCTCGPTNGCGKGRRGEEKSGGGEGEHVESVKKVRTTGVQKRRWQVKQGVTGELIRAQPDKEK